MGDVHSSHCCTRCGCKYGNDNCTVVLGTEEQEYPCEDCEPILEAEVRLRTEGATAERTRIVAYLRHWAKLYNGSGDYTEALTDAADEIERGDHLTPPREGE